MGKVFQRRHYPIPPKCPKIHKGNTNLRPHLYRTMLLYVVALGITLYYCAVQLSPEVPINTYTSSTPSNLSLRALDEQWGRSVEQGFNFMCSMKYPKPGYQFPWRFEDLALNGWTVYPGPEGLFGFPDIHDALNDLQISNLGKYAIRQIRHDKESKGEDDEIIPPSGAEYWIFCTNGRRVLIAGKSTSPRAAINQRNPEATGEEHANMKVPKLYNWSDVVFLVWTDLMRRVQIPERERGHLQYLFQTDITNLETKEILIQALGQSSAMWPGQKFEIIPEDLEHLSDNSKNKGLAILGTPRGNGVGALIALHHPYFKDVATHVTVFTERDPDEDEDGGDGYNYNLLWEFGVSVFNLPPR